MVTNTDPKKNTEGEFASSDSKPKVGYVSGPTFTNLRIEYAVINGWAIAEGDICLGTAEQLEKSSDPSQLDAAASRATMDSEMGLRYEAGFIREERFRWLNCTIPYAIDPNLPSPTRVTDAISHWTQHTGIQFVRRTTEADYLYFTDEGGCWSMIGRQGGLQKISLGTGCSTGNAIHEIGHAVGLYHEQSRNDRDMFVRINWQNIISGREHNFNQYMNNGIDVGPYDYCSIMHYPRTAFSSNGQDTITPLQPVTGCTMGQRTGLSPQDIAAVRSIYNCPRIVVTNPIRDVKLPIRDVKLPIRDVKHPIRDPIKHPNLDRVTIPRIDVRTTIETRPVDDFTPPKIPSRDKPPIRDSIGPTSPLADDPNLTRIEVIGRGSIGGLPIQPDPYYETMYDPYQEYDPYEEYDPYQEYDPYEEYDPYAPFVLATPHMAPEWEEVEAAISPTPKSPAIDTNPHTDVLTLPRFDLGTLPTRDIFTLPRIDFHTNPIRDRYTVKRIDDRAPY